MGLFNLLSRDKNKTEETLDRGLEKSKRGFLDKIKRAFAGRNTIDDDFLDELEEAFITSDVGVDTTLKIIDRLRERVRNESYVNLDELNSLLVVVVSEMLDKDNGNRATVFSVLGGDAASEPMPQDPEPYVIMVVGVNGVGKTTTIGKLASQFQKAGLKVMLGAADTFRAAASEQLAIWGERAGVPVVSQGQGADPAAVAYDTLQSAKANGIDVVLIDTAGRLHNKKGLMDELTKIKNVMKRIVPDAPHEVLMVIDGSTGQNAFEQTKQFVAATEVTSLAVTKLDGSAKGGVVIGISDSFNIPVRFIGLGEGIDDLQPFEKMEFVKSLFGNK